jgi:predicted nucleic acid-binding protein
MMVVVDTCIWSLALRRARRIDDAIPGELTELVTEGRVVLLGPVRQELLSGVKLVHQFEHLREHLRAFPDLSLEAADYEDAAQMYNRCRAHGVQGSNTDFLISAVAVRRKFSIFTTDVDFKHYSQLLPLVLHVPRRRSMPKRTT